MKLNIFTSTTKDGIMSNEKKYFPTLTTEERNLLYETTITRFLAKANLKRENVVILPATSIKIASRTVTSSTKKIKEAILLLKSTTKDLVVAAETVDYPIIVATAKTKDDKSVSAIALGTLENINNDILHEMIESLIKETDAAPFEMTFYIGACPNKENLVLRDISTLTNNLIWSDALTKKKNKYYLDLRYAIFNTLIKEIVDPNYIYFSSVDPTSDANYFSNIGNKPGKNLVCVVYTDEKI